MNIELVKNIATTARKVMESYHNDLSSTYFGNFPSGACGNTSDILALYMSTKGIEEIEYISGRRSQRSHGWLEIGEYIIDITSDQFSDGLGPVYVGGENKFHHSFGNKRRSTPSISNCLIGSYNKFKKLMDENI